MKIKEKKELENKSVEELRKLLAETAAQKNSVALQLSQYKAKNTRELFLKRKDIAQILTVLTMKEKEVQRNKVIEK